LNSGYEVWRLRLSSFCGYGLTLAALALVLFGAYDSYPADSTLRVSEDLIERKGERFQEQSVGLLHYIASDILTLKERQMRQRRKVKILQVLSEGFLPIDEDNVNRKLTKM